MAKNWLGDRFGRLVVIGGPEVVGTNRKFVCRCDCGDERAYYLASLVSGRSKSCGCLCSGLARLAHLKHGEADLRNGRRTPEYRTWINIKSRCQNPRASGYKDYGGRGIHICEKWGRDFSAFVADVGRRPSPLHSIDRVDVNGHYEPGNVRWATRLEQNNNTRRHAQRAAA